MERKGDNIMSLVECQSINKDGGKGDYLTVNHIYYVTTKPTMSDGLTTSELINSGALKA